MMIMPSTWGRTFRWHHISYSHCEEMRESQPDHWLLLQVGMMVKCCRTYEEVYDGDIGKVIKLDRDGLHDLNVQCDWQQKGGTYWVRYIHIELLGKMAFLEYKRKTKAAVVVCSFGHYLFFNFYFHCRISTPEFSFTYKNWWQSEGKAHSCHSKV